jgi:hypothetical protein
MCFTEIWKSISHLYESLYFTSRTPYSVTTHEYDIYVLQERCCHLFLKSCKKPNLEDLLTDWFLEAFQQVLQVMELRELLE